MKKWLLLSTILNILILQIPLSNKNNIKKEKEITKLRLNLSAIHSNSDKVKNKELPLIDKSKLFNEKKQESTNDSNNKNSDFNNENITYNIEATQNKSQEIIENVAISTKNENITISSSNEKEITDKTSESLSDSAPIFSDSSIKKIVSFSNGTNETAIILEKDENILVEGSVNLVKENKDLEYKIIKSKSPVYPKKAQILNLKENVKVIAEFTVNTNGEIKDISLFSDFVKYKQYDFDKAVDNALKSYKFSTIFYKNQIVEVRFRKVFEFNLK